jgi:hypothetical protein
MRRGLECVGSAVPHTPSLGTATADAESEKSVISCKTIIPCESVLIDLGSQYLTTVHIYDSWRAALPFPVNLPRIAAGIVIERESRDSPIFDGEIRVRLGSEVVASSPARIDFGTKLIMRAAFGPVTGLVATEPTSVSVELWHAGPGGKMIHNARFPLLPMPAATTKH